MFLSRKCKHNEIGLLVTIPDVDELLLLPEGRFFRCFLLPAAADVVPMGAAEEAAAALAAEVGFFWSASWADSAAALVLGAAGGEEGLVNNSIRFRWLFTIKHQV